MNQNADYPLSGILSRDEFEQFEAARANLKPFRATGRPDRLTEFFCLEDFEGLLNQTSIWTPDRLEALIDTKKVPPQNFYQQFPLHNGTRLRIDAARLQKLIDMGASVVLNDIDGMTEGLKTLKKTIGGYTGGKVECNLYYSQLQHQAFTVHFDMHDVYAFQVAGKKRWRVYQQVHRFPIRHLAFMSGDVAQHEQAKGPVSADFLMEQGDFVYLPSGYYHEAICIDSISTHISFSSVEMIGLDVISELFDRGVLDEFFRTPIRRTEGGKLAVADYLKLLNDNIARVMDSEPFVHAIDERLQSFQHSTGNITIKK